MFPLLAWTEILFERNLLFAIKYHICIGFSKPLHSSLTLLLFYDNEKFNFAFT